MRSSSKLLLIAILFALNLCVFSSHPEPEFLDVQEDMSSLTEEGKRLLASTTYPKLRMTALYDAMNYTSAYTAYFKNELIPPILSFFQAALKVKYPVTGTISLPATTKTICGVTVPQALYTGIAADYVIIYNNYDYKASTGTSSVTVASSYACKLATGTKRPLIVNTKINPAVLVDAGDNVLLHEKNMYLIMHELTHTLGFQKSLYRYFLDENGVLRTGHMKNITLNGATSLVIDVPPLTQKLRTFFGCSTLEGAFMENSGSSATAGDHFERKMFVFEAMTSGLIYQQSYSQFTLAMLEGSGWYVANYSMADPYFFGQGQGCNFLKKTCDSAGYSYDEFCTGSAKGCSVQGRGAGFCQSDLRSDNCRYFLPSINNDCESDDYISTSSARLPTVEAYGRNSGAKCFTGTLSAKSSSSFQTSFCFKPTCSGTGTSTVVNIQVGTTTVACKAEGPTKVTGYYGTINCPDPITYCSTVGALTCPRGCMGRGNCVKGKCACFKGFTGKDCALNL